MREERWVVYEVTDRNSGAREEVSWHRTADAAKDAARKHHQRTGRAITVDFDINEITRNGREIVFSDADIWSLGL